MLRSITVPTTLDQMTDSRNQFLGETGGLAVLPERADQLCAVAAALDVLGDHSSLFLLRDLLWHGPQTATGLAERNPGIGVTEAIERLERLEEVGMVESYPLQRADDIAFRLTALGRSADMVVRALYGFGLTVVRRRPITAAMLAQVVRVAAIDRHDDLLRLDLSAVVGLDVAGRRMGVVMAPGILRADAAVDTDVEVGCTQDVFVDLLSGLIRVEDAIRRGELDIDGPAEPVAALFELLAGAVVR